MRLKSFFLVVLIIAAVIVTTPVSAESQDQTVAQTPVVVVVQAPKGVFAVMVALQILAAVGIAWILGEIKKKSVLARIENFADTAKTEAKREDTPKRKARAPADAIIKKRTGKPKAADSAINERAAPGKEA